MSTGDRDEALIRLDKMVWAFHSSLSGKFSNPENEVAFQAEPYKNIDPEDAESIIAATCCPNHAMHKISNLVNILIINILRRNDIDKDIMTFEYTLGVCEHLLSFSFSVLYTHNTDRLLRVWKILLLFDLYNAF